jgi:hypothetical protein
MSTRSYENDHHRMVAQSDFGIYNWKTHSTGYLLSMLRSTDSYNYYDSYSSWVQEWRTRIKDELAKRPHLPNKKERRKKRH